LRATASDLDETSQDGALPVSLIPVLVTGIQSREVIRVERLFRAADATLLDSCDEHRNEGGWGGVASHNIVRDAEVRCADSVAEGAGSTVISCIRVG
jgi:hypothetical protein